MEIFQPKDRLLLLLLLLAMRIGAIAQGPNSPGTMSNSTAVGANAWTNTGNAVSSNNAYASVATKGLTNYLRARNFGFSIAGPANVAGIQLDVERSTLNPLNVTLLDGWTTGLTKTVSAGTNRCLIVIACQENGTTYRDITAVTYGGRAMTQVTQIVVGGGSVFSATIEIWMLLEAQIALAANTTIIPTYGAATQVEYCQTFSAAVFQNVDQTVPVSSTQSSGAIGTANPHQLGTAIATRQGSMAITAVTCGNNTTPAISDGGTNTYTVNSGFTEGTDIYFANASMPTSGACFLTAHKAIATAGSEQPSFTFAGTVNRYAMVGITLQRPREVDYLVRLVDAGTVVGNSLAGTAPWTTTDTYVSYGGPTQLWGHAWTLADINSSTFGAAFAAQVQNGTARVDHMRITVYVLSTLPIELLYFTAEEQDGKVALRWATASELNNDHFVIQRSRDGITFDDIDQVPGAGNSSVLLEYSAMDDAPGNGTIYYRLEQVDTDGSTDRSSIVTVQIDEHDLVIYPNPTADGNVYLQGLDELDDLAIYTTDMKLVRTIRKATGDPMVQLGDLPDGTYLIMVRGIAGVRTSKVIKASREI